MKQIIIILFIGVFLAACAAKPKVVEVSSPRDAQLTCPQLKQEIRQAEQYQLAARREDRFRASYIAIVPAMISLYNMDKAEKAADERILHLRRLYRQKQCLRPKQAEMPPAFPIPTN